MKVETLYNQGDALFFICENEIRNEEIEDVVVKITDGGFKLVHYYFTQIDSEGEVLKIKLNEKSVFKTEKDLLSYYRRVRMMQSIHYKPSEKIKDDQAREKSFEKIIEKIKTNLSKPYPTDILTDKESIILEQAKMNEKTIEGLSIDKYFLKLEIENLEKSNGK